MGEHHAPQRPGGQLRPVAPTHRQGRPRQPLPLASGHAGIGFHQHQLKPGRQPWPAERQGSSELAGQITLARTGLDQGQGTGSQRLQPFGQLGGQQVCEGGAQGGRGGEIPPGPHPQATGAVGAVVWIMESPFHEGKKRHRPPSRLQPLDQPGRCQLGFGTLAAIRRIRRRCF